jgi:hypothetical protein
MPTAVRTRVDARPASSRTTACNWRVSRTVRRWYRSNTPGICSRKVLLGQVAARHRRRRTRTRTVTGRPSTGTSAGARSWNPCTRAVGVPHPGHGTGALPVLACTMITSPASSTPVMINAVRPENSVLRREAASTTRTEAGHPRADQPHNAPNPANPAPNRDLPQTHHRKCARADNEIVPYGDRIRLLAGPGLWWSELIALDLADIDLGHSG